MVDAVKFVRKVAQTEPFASIVEAEELPAPEVWDSDEALYGETVVSRTRRLQADRLLLDYVRKNTSSSYRKSRQRLMRSSL